MGELINLKRVRKRRDKNDASKAAELNRVKFGRPKAERDRIAAETAQADKALDQHKLPEGDAS